MAECLDTVQEKIINENVIEDKQSIVNINQSNNDSSNGIIQEFKENKIDCKISEVKKESFYFDMKEPVAYFTGRQDELEKLHRVIQTGNAVISQMVLVSGLGGIGKSEMARKYAFIYQDEYDNKLIWINSETHDSLKGSFTRLAETLKIPLSPNGQDKNLELIIRQIYVKVCVTRSLFIFDNAEEYKIIKDFLPNGLSADFVKPHVLITSRIQYWESASGGPIEVINLANFTPEEAFCFIKDSLKASLRNISNDDEIKELAMELDNFPLALGLAVAYIKEEARISRHYEISEYLKEFKEQSHKSKMFQHEDSRYNETIQTTCCVTLKKIETQNSDSIKIIEVMAYLVSDTIERDGVFSESIKDSKRRNEAFDLLIKYSMINEKDDYVSIHRLVQKVIRLKLEKQEKERNVLQNSIELLGFKLNLINISKLISIWNNACEYNQLIDEYFMKYFYNPQMCECRDWSFKISPFNFIVGSGNVKTITNILNRLSHQSKKEFWEVLNPRNDFYGSPLAIAILNNDTEMVKVLKEFGAEDNFKPCVHFIFKGDVDIVRHLYPKNIEFINNAEFYSAIKSKNLESIESLLKGLTDQQIENILEQNLTNIDDKLIKGHFKPALHTATYNGNIDLVKLLINYKANVNINWSDETPLHVTVYKGYLEIFILLIENGANLNAVDYFGRTVFLSAVQDGKLEMLKYLMDNTKCDLNSTDTHGNSHLHTAMIWGHLKSAEFLLKCERKKELNLNAINDQGLSPLFHAVFWNKCEIAKLLMAQNSIKMTQILNSKGYPTMKISIFLFAIACDSVEIVKFLIEEKGRMLLSEKVFEERNFTAIHLAALFNSKKLIEYFKNELLMTFDETFDRILKDSIEYGRHLIDYCDYMEEFCRYLSELSKY